MSIELFLQLMLRLSFKYSFFSYVCSSPILLETSRHSTRVDISVQFVRGFRFVALFNGHFLRYLFWYGQVFSWGGINCQFMCLGSKRRASFFFVTNAVFVRRFNSIAMIYVQFRYYSDCIFECPIMSRVFITMFTGFFRFFARRARSRTWPQRTMGLKWDTKSSRVQVFIRRLFSVSYIY